MILPAELQDLGRLLQRNHYFEWIFQYHIFTKKGRCWQIKWASLMRLLQFLHAACVRERHARTDTPGIEQQRTHHRSINLLYGISPASTVMEPEYHPTSLDQSVSGLDTSLDILHEWTLLIAPALSLETRVPDPWMWRLLRHSTFKSQCFQHSHP